MPTYEHLCEACNEEFEDDYSIVKDPPTTCPLCKVEGKVKRLISGGSGRGIVTLGHQEFKEKAVTDANNLRREIRSNENIRANIIGEDTYHQSELNKDAYRKKYNYK